jgi:hypothetical protein
MFLSIGRHLSNQMPLALNRWRPDGKLLEFMGSSWPLIDTAPMVGRKGVQKKKTDLIASTRDT